jgi:SAM-dependent methyltransferase
VDDDSWRKIRELHVELVALESEMAILRERSRHARDGRARRGLRRAKDLTGRGERRLRAVATRLPDRVKSALRALLGDRIRPRPTDAEQSPYTMFRDSAVAHRFLDGLAGIEVGGSAHNPFHIAGCLNVDYTDQATVFTAEQVRIYGEAARVDVVSQGDDLPFPDMSLDYVLSSHVLEHFYDPVGAIREWLRVVRPGGYVFMVVPHRDRTFDRDRSLTSVEELLGRHSPNGAADGSDDDTAQRDAHHSVWTTQTFLDFCTALDLRVVYVDDVDDKVGNGFTVVIQR